MKDLNDALAENEVDATDAFLKIAARAQARPVFPVRLPSGRALLQRLLLGFDADAHALRRVAAAPGPPPHGHGFHQPFHHALHGPGYGLSHAAPDHARGTPETLSVRVAQGVQGLHRPSRRLPHLSAGPGHPARRAGKRGGTVFSWVREPHCRGFEETASWDAPAWLSDQDLAAYNQFNDRYMRLMALARGKGAALSAKQTQMVWLAQYQPDAFQEFINKMGLFNLVEIDDARQERIMTDEEEALTFGLDWLELAFFGIQDRLRRKRPRHP